MEKKLVFKNLAREPLLLIHLVVVATVFGWLFFGQGYASGYFEKRDPVIKDVIAGFKRGEGEWSFGYFVPFIVLFLAWLKREELLKTPIKPSPVVGFLVLGVGFLLYFGGYKANVVYGGYIAGQVLVAGAIIWFLGLEWFKKTFWLWCLFGMMWPNVFLIQPISNPLREVMVALTTSFLNLVGVESLRSGTTVMTSTLDPVTGETINLNIAKGCSGMRSLFALVMIGLVFAVFAVREEWKRWILMLLVPMIAVLGNFARMLILYLAARFFGSKFAIGEGQGNESTFHIASGLVTFVVALILLSLIVGVMNNGVKSILIRRKTIIRKVSS